MNRKARALLCDVVELLEKHDFEAFELLVREIKARDLIESIVLRLQRADGEITPRATKQTVGNSRRKRERPIQSVLEEIANTDPDKGRLLLGFREGLVAGTFLPTLRDVRVFAERSGLQSLRVTSRAGAINALLRDLSSLPIDQVRSLLDHARQAEPQSDRSLARWSELILEGPRRITEDTFEQGAPDSGRGVKSTLSVPDWLLGGWQSSHGPSLLAESGSITIYVEEIGVSQSIFNSRLYHRERNVREERSESRYRIRNGRLLQVSKLGTDRIKVLLEGNSWEMTRTQRG